MKYEIMREFLKRENQCKARTIKGMQCLKCAKEGEVLCAVHLGLSVYNKGSIPIEKRQCPEEASARCSLCGKYCRVICFGNISRLQKEWDERKLKKNEIL
jgi:hypothetical protein